MKVFKFGGASVKDADGVRNLAKIIKEYSSEKLVVVVSAMGKTTNALEEIHKIYYSKERAYSNKIEEIKKYHHQIIVDLGLVNNENLLNEINNLFVEIDWCFEEEIHPDENFVYDQIVSIGELLSTKIIYYFLKEEGIKSTWVDIRNILFTDNSYREARVEIEKTEEFAKKIIEPLLNVGIAISQGFIGCTSENYTTTLGREGSDYTGAILANVLDAESLTIWKDVPGVMSADPKLFEEVFLYEHLPYSEAIEMTYYGANVIHPKTIKPLQNKNIPLYVRSFYSFEEKGTAIGVVDNIDFKHPAVIVKKNQILISISTKDFSFIGENNFSFLFGMFAYHHLKINMMQNSALSFSICCDNDFEKIIRLLNDLKSDYKILYNEDLELITVRHYNKELEDKLLMNKELILEQRSRNTLQLVVK